jgi:hypothetical protein
MSGLVAKYKCFVEDNEMLKWDCAKEKEQLQRQVKEITDQLSR